MNDNVLSQIKILDSDSVRSFEWSTPDSSGSELTVDDIRLIRNPFPVVPLGKGEYLLLEDAPLFRLLVEDGIAQIPAHVYSDSSVAVQSESLALQGFGYHDLCNLAARHPEQVVLTEPDHPGPVGFMAFRFEFPSKAPLLAYLRHSSRTGCPASLKHLFHAILSAGSYYPAFDISNTEDVVVKKTVSSGNLYPPVFSLDQLKSAAMADRLFPPDIVRVQADCRVISIDFPLSVLRADISCEEKDKFLRQLILFREQSRRTAVIHGQVYILNR